MSSKRQYAEDPDDIGNHYAYSYHILAVWSTRAR